MKTKTNSINHYRELKKKELENLNKATTRRLDEYYAATEEENNYFRLFPNSELSIVEKFLSNNNNQ
jgi:hypothetical protein